MHCCFLVILDAFLVFICSNPLVLLQVDGFRFDLMGHIMKRTMV